MMDETLARISIAETIPIEDYTAAEHAAELLQGSITQDPRLAYWALSRSIHALATELPVDQIILSPELDDRHREAVKQAAGLLAITGNGRYLDFDPATEDALAKDPAQRQLGIDAQRASGRQEFPALRRKAAISALLFFVKRSINQDTRQDVSPKLAVQAESSIPTGTSTNDRNETVA